MHHDACVSILDRGKENFINKTKPTENNPVLGTAIPRRSKCIIYFVYMMCIPSGAAQVGGDYWLAWMRILSRGGVRAVNR